MKNKWKELISKHLLSKKEDLTSKKYCIKCKSLMNYMPYTIDYCTKKRDNPKSWPFYDHFWPFSANYINIFHKTGVKRNILRCLTCLNFHWIKSYDMWVFNFVRRKFTPHKRSFYDHFWPFFYQLHRNLSQNWGSYFHFEMLSVSIF